MGSSWWLFQLAAVAAGALALRAKKKTIAPYAVGVSAAAVCAVIFGSFAPWASWLVRGGALPDVEIAGSGALAGLTLGYLIAGRGNVKLDDLAPAIGPMLAIARLGCFFAGCDFGSPTSLPWGIRYPHFTPAFRAQLAERLITVSATETLPVHPTQLYESLVGVVLFFVARTPRAPFRAVIVTYALARFVIDFLRGDLARGTLGLSPSQCLAVGAVALVLLVRRPSSSPSSSSTEDRSSPIRTYGPALRPTPACSSSEAPPR